VCVQEAFTETMPTLFQIDREAATVPTMNEPRTRAMLTMERSPCLTSNRRLILKHRTKPA
jgi:hypothetical protein